MSRVDPSSEKVVAEVLAERERQKSAEGWTAEHDDQHEGGALASAAAAYAHRAQFELRPKNAGRDLPELDVDMIITELWPFDERWWKPKGARRDLIRAAALIVAEIERLDRRGK